nr:MAG TPA: hypothetical protein [Caudoviricetes sp.]
MTRFDSLCCYSMVGIFLRKNEVLICILFFRYWI